MKKQARKLDVLEGGQWFVRAHPEMFFPHGVSAHYLVGALIEEALILGATDIGLVECLGWHSVGADVDWFHAGQFQPGAHDIFDRILAFPERGQNAMRAEVLIAVAATDTVTLTPSTRRVVSGTCDVLDDLAALLQERRWKRLVSFRLGAAPN